jgi:hypothetical protein
LPTEFTNITKIGASPTKVGSLSAINKGFHMSDRFQTATVAFDKSYREEDLQVLLNAIRQLKGVATVQLGTPKSFPEFAAESTVLREFIGTMFGLMNLRTLDLSAWAEIEAIVEKATKRIN